MIGNEKVKNIAKWGVYETGAVVALCHLILLFTDIKLLGGIGILFTILYHISVIACPALIVWMLVQESDDEVRGSNLIALQLAMSGLIDICMLVKYVRCVNQPDVSIEQNSGLVFFVILLAIVEFVAAFVFVQYGRDKVTCIFAFMVLVVDVIMKMIVSGSVDSHLESPQIKINVKFSSIWSFLTGVFLLIFVACYLLYEDYFFLEELRDSHQNIFSKKALFGTYYNTYMKNGTEQNPAMTSAPGSRKIGSGQNCPKCGFPLAVDDIHCPECGFMIHKLD